MPTIIGVKFNKGNKMYYYSPKKEIFKIGDGAIVETAKGLEYVTVVKENTEIDEKEVVQPLKEITRKANEKDAKQAQDNIQRAEKALKICQEKIEKHKLDMKLINAEYTFDRSKVVFNFTADGRVDFRELVKDLASDLHVRIELRQVYEKDDVKLRGAMGQCGEECCCIRCPEVCDKATIKMAKAQGLSLNPTKVAGMCGKLMCCLKFENDFYVETLKKMPKVNAMVKVKEGMAKVLSVDVLKESITCSIEIDDLIVDRVYKIGEFELLNSNNKEVEEDVDDEELKSLEE